MGESIGKMFMEKTEYRHLSQSDQKKGLAQPPLEIPAPLEQVGTIDLPAPEEIKLGGIPLRQVIDVRRSRREYSSTPLSLEELSHLLWCTQGIKKLVPGRATLRTVPSAGARHPLETAILVNRVSGLEPGLYWFPASEHRLVKLVAEPDITARITAACLNQPFVATSAATFIWIADTYRMAWRYGERGYRYLHLDAGHVCQNLYLAAEAISAGACAIGAFSDQAMNELLGLTKSDRFVIYMATVGKQKSV
ncbi:SagB/ThcOx family dehydrogenase [Candidatus Bipolaricaulota bacterium]|nr:SagB/ThcOx family dehydrogenase [Candidatus Bipolaricaulota bacterium]